MIHLCSFCIIFIRLTLRQRVIWEQHLWWKNAWIRIWIWIWDFLNSSFSLSLSLFFFLTHALVSCLFNLWSSFCVRKSKGDEFFLFFFFLSLPEMVYGWQRSDGIWGGNALGIDGGLSDGRGWSEQLILLTNWKTWFDCCSLLRMEIMNGMSPFMPLIGLVLNFRHLHLPLILRMVDMMLGLYMIR